MTIRTVQESSRSELSSTSFDLIKVYLFFVGSVAPEGLNFLCFGRSAIQLFPYVFATDRGSIFLIALFLIPRLYCNGVSE